MTRRILGSRTGLPEPCADCGEALCVCPSDELATLRVAMSRARRKYPQGATLLALAAEFGEVAQAVQKLESADRVRAELLDVAVVAMRLYLGERAP